MTITTLSSREFNQDAGKAKKAAKKGPVFITDRGQPAHVLLSIEAYRKLRGEKRTSLLGTLAQSGADADFDFEPPKLGSVVKPADLD